MNEDFYDRKIARNYENKRKADRYWDWEESTLLELVARLKEVEHKRILDCPVGTGRFIEKLAPKCSQYTGVDISKHMLEVAEEKLCDKIGNVNFLQCDVTSLDIDVDLIICFRLLHLVDTENAIKLISKLSHLTNGYIILQAFDVHDYRISLPRFRNLIASSKSVIRFGYMYRSIRSLVSGKIFRKGGCVSVSDRHGDYSEETYWLNMRTILSTFKKNNMKIVSEIRLTDNHHYEKENHFVSTKIILVQSDA